MGDRTVVDQTSESFSEVAVGHDVLMHDTRIKATRVEVEYGDNSLIMVNRNRSVQGQCDGKLGQLPTKID